MQGIRLAGIIHSIVVKRHGLQVTTMIIEWLQFMLHIVDIKELNIVKIFLSETEKFLINYKADSQKMVGYNNNNNNY
jgi:hypothetical protein